MKLPILYSRTNLGKVQQWEIITDGDSFYTIEGEKNGKLTTSKPTVCKAKNVGKKNESTPTEQAILEAQAKWDKKCKHGYFESITDIDNEIYFEPMLAKNYDDYKEKINWEEGVGVQIKFNGGRIIGKKSGLFTRKGEKYVSIPHIEEGLKPLFEKYPDAVTDGEGFNFVLRNKLNEIMKLLRRTVNVTTEDLEKSKELIRYNIYDGIGIGGTTLEDGYLKRKGAIDEELKLLYGRGVFEEVTTYIVHSKEELDKIYQTFLEDKQEGAIIRILNKPYENKRSQYLLKYKPVNDTEFFIVDVIEGEGGRAGMAGAISCKMKDGRIFNASMKGDEKQFAEVWANRKNYIGQIVTIYYNGLTGKGIPNFARFDCDNFRKS
jgi:DNA ligase-1